MGCEGMANGPDQWLATKELSTPLGFIASPLHRLVLHAWFLFLRAIGSDHWLADAYAGTSLSLDWAGGDECSDQLSQLNPVAADGVRKRISP